MKLILRLAQKRVLRFAVVGTSNALISFGVLNIVFYAFNSSKIVASIVATSCALMFSFFMNRNFVFADKTKKAHKQAIPFVVVTISGTIIVLNSVYLLSLKLLDGREQPLIDLAHAITGLVLSQSFVDINLSTAIGAVVAMIWNYNGYRWFVFKRSTAEELLDATNTSTA
ncbi:MAG: hypothetical protein JWO35_155 [Candidatus Saccharibacteria bacterium]|nr:hypothetical protein [Candidatus Saccharibacteria bacterium]